VVDHVHLAEALLNGPDLAGQVRIGAGERPHVVGGPEAGVGGRRRVDGYRRADHRGGHGHDDEGQDEQLLAPPAVEQAPGPAHHRLAGRDAAARALARRHIGDGSFEEAGAHE
jgi:hypothetical protein